MRTVVCFVSLMLLSVVYSCKDSKDTSSETKPLTKESLRASIQEMEDSVSHSSNATASGASFNLSQLELINRLTLYYRIYPEDPFSADCLFKVQMLYSGLNAHRKSIAYGDTILRKFPSYKNKHLVIESNVAALDVFLEPRDTAMIRTYYTMLLSDNEYPKTKKAEINRRLKFLHLSIFDYANLPKNRSVKK